MHIWLRIASSRVRPSQHSQRPDPTRTAGLLHDARAAAHAASLRYVAVDEPGIVRLRHGKGFSYRLPNGKHLKLAKELARIQQLAIPPAWNNVWIALSPSAHIQATGVDQRGRKQYRYHAQWRKVRDSAKHADIALFARALPRLRRRLARDLRQPGLGKDKVVATVIALMERSLLRVGNAKYERENHSFGLTTLRDRHVHISGAKVSFRFRAKGGKALEVELCDRRLARAAQRCRDVPGSKLFQYLDARGRRYGVTSADVNAYLRETMGRPFSAKQFRTWAASSLVTQQLLRCECPSSARQGKREIARITECVADELGHTAAICRKSYIHPALFERYLNGELEQLLSRARARARRQRPTGLSVKEATVMNLLGSFSELR